MNRSNRLVIEVSGGVVTGIYSDETLPALVFVVDWDEKQIGGFIKAQQRAISPIRYSGALASKILPRRKTYH